MPPLTAVRLPTYQVGRELVGQLMGVIEKREQPAAVVLQPQLIVRKSCGRSIRPGEGWQGTVAAASV